MKNSYQVGYLCGYMQKRAQDGEALTPEQKEYVAEVANKARRVAGVGAGTAALTGATLATGAGAAAGAGIAGKGRRLRGAMIGGATGLVAAPMVLGLSSMAGYLAAKHSAKRAFGSQEAADKAQNFLKAFGSDKA